MNYESGPSLATVRGRSGDLRTGGDRRRGQRIDATARCRRRSRRCPASRWSTPVRTSATARRPTVGWRRLADLELLLVCNPDLEVPAGAVDVLAAAIDADPACALVGPLIRTPDGDRYPSARRFPSMVDAAGHALLGSFAPENRFTRNYQTHGPRRGPGQHGDGRLGVRRLLPGAPGRLRGGRRVRRVLLHVRRGRRPLLAAGPGRPSGRLRPGRRSHPRSRGSPPTATPTG